MILLLYDHFFPSAANKCPNKREQHQMRSRSDMSVHAQVTLCDQLTSYLTRFKPAAQSTASASTASAVEAPQGMQVFKKKGSPCLMPSPECLHLLHVSLLLPGICCYCCSALVNLLYAVWYSSLHLSYRRPAMMFSITAPTHSCFFRYV